jgi:phage shock protein A
METFAYSFAAQHEKLEQLEGSLRKLMTENEQLRANKDFAVRLNSNSTKTQEKDVKVFMT